VKLIIPDAKFLEEYPLYRKFDFELGKDSFMFPITIDDFPKVNLNMYCPNCNNIRTFKFNYKYIHKKEKKLFVESIDDHFEIKVDFSRANRLSSPVLEEKDIVNLNYICASCEDYYRFFALKMGKGLKTIEKVGQYPPWDINIKKNLRKILGEYSIYYKKGLICESEASGIGANIYYRRIVEGIIGELLEDLKEFLVGEEREKYEKVLYETKRIRTAQDKIKLVKNLIPPILMIGSQNPLTVLYDILSGGIHGKTDEECLAEAGLIRTSLVFLVNSILNRRRDQQEYTESMKILEKQRKKTKRDETRNTLDDKFKVKKRK